MGTVMTSGPSFSPTSPTPEVPYYRVAGPTYAAMIEILLEYVSRNAAGATKPSVALVYSDTSSGAIRSRPARQRRRSSAFRSRSRSSPSGRVDVSAEMIKLRRAKPDFVIFHGYVLAPIPEFVRQMREAG